MKEIFRISLDKNKPLTELFTGSSESNWHTFYIRKINEIIFYKLEETDLDKKNEGEKLDV